MNGEHIETAFLQLSFALKLWHYLDEHPINKDEFDIPLTIQDQRNRVCLPGDEFRTYEAIQVASKNNVLIAFGAAAITLWEAIRERSSIKPQCLNPSNGKKDELAAFSYMLRCCFAHGMAAPVWLIENPKYKVRYHIGNMMVDLSELDGMPFDYQSIKGHDTLWLLKAESYANGLI
jgi:hypothetical protein